jgi:hypothetical protein
MSATPRSTSGTDKPPIACAPPTIPRWTSRATRANTWSAGPRCLSPLALVQSTVQWSRGRGWYNDPYKHTLTFYPNDAPAFAVDTRPSHRNSLALDHALSPARPRGARDCPGRLPVLSRRLGESVRTRSRSHGASRSARRWSLRPALRLYSQSRADFYSPLIPQPRPRSSRATSASRPSAASRHRFGQRSNSTAAGGSKARWAMCTTPRTFAGAPAATPSRLFGRTTASPA